MLGKASREATMLTAVTPDALIPQGRPIWSIKPMVDQALAQLSHTFDRMYAANGRASIPPEHLLKACLLMALFSVRSERQFCERLEYDLLFKWFLDLNIMDHSFDHSVFSKNKQRLLDADVARGFLLQIVEQAREQRLLPTQSDIVPLSATTISEIPNSAANQRFCDGPKSISRGSPTPS